jgi:hypothetical protein
MSYDHYARQGVEMYRNAEKIVKRLFDENPQKSSSHKSTTVATVVEHSKDHKYQVVCHHHVHVYARDRVAGWLHDWSIRGDAIAHQW